MSDERDPLSELLDAMPPVRPLPSMPVGTFTCPTNARKPDDIVGCGATFEAAPDFEGAVDCPKCGMWFTPGDDEL